MGTVDTESRTFGISIGRRPRFTVNTTCIKPLLIWMGRNKNKKKNIYCHKTHGVIRHLVIRVSLKSFKYLRYCIKGRHTWDWCRWDKGLVCFFVVGYFSYIIFKGFERPGDRVSLRTPTSRHCYFAWTKPVWDWCRVMDGRQKSVRAQWRTRSTIRHCRKTDRQTLTSPSDSVLCLIGS